MLIRNPKYQTRFYFFFFEGLRPIPGPGLFLRGFKIALIGHITLGRTPLDEYPSRRRDRYLTTHKSHKRQTSMIPPRFEPAIPPSKHPSTHALDRAATGIGEFEISPPKIWTDLRGFTFSKINPTSKIYQVGYAQTKSRLLYTCLKMLPFQVLHQKNYKSDLQSDSWEMILNNVQSRILHNPLGLEFVASHLAFFTNGKIRFKNA
jgi:hypothetical protein